MNKKEAALKILKNKKLIPKKNEGKAFANSNIALIKYWGKRNEDLILPNTSSLSISLNNLGTNTIIKLAHKDKVILNNEELDLNHNFSKRIFNFIDLFRDKECKFEIKTYNNIPTSVGVASSASGGAALVLALNDLFEWDLSKKNLSILARLFSGSACRSIYQDTFVIWNKGNDINGMDSYAIPLKHKWKDLSIGIIIIDDKEKKISSREAMKLAHTSSYYKEWPRKVESDLKNIIEAIKQKDFNLLGRIAENNSLFMHKIIQTTKSPFNYLTEKTELIINKIYKFRKEKKIPIYFTIDAGPNIKLIYLKEFEEEIKNEFYLS